MQAIVASRQVPGILAYAGRAPIGWCAVAPRDAYPGLERSRLFQRLDDAPVWSVTCFFIAKEYRQQGVTVKLLRAAIEHVARRGGTILEGYPIDPKAGSVPAAFAWTGLAAAFRQAGFVECKRPSPTRPYMRYDIAKSKSATGH